MCMCDCGYVCGRLREKAIKKGYDSFHLESHVFIFYYLNQILHIIDLNINKNVWPHLVFVLVSKIVF